MFQIQAAETSRCKPMAGVAFILLTVAVPLSSSYADPDSRKPSMSALEACAAIVEERERVQCYDEVVRGMQRTAHPQAAADPQRTTSPARDAPLNQKEISTTRVQPDNGQVRPSETPAEEALAADDRAQFGADDLPDQNRHKGRTRSVLATVEAVDADVRGYAVFELDNGQTWRQSTYGRNPIAAGTEVRIKRSIIGAYHMRAADGSSRSVRVARIR